MRVPTAPLWLRWLLSVLLFGGMFVALVAVVSNSGNAARPAAESPRSEAQANRLGQIVTAQDQSPHRAALPRSIPPVIALERAITSDMRERVTTHDIDGPVQRVRCTPTASRSTGRLAFRCVARAGGFDYPFDGVADRRAGQLVWCKNDSVSVDAGLQVPISPACTG